LRGTRFPVYLAAAALLILTAGCGWVSGPTFQGDYNPDDNTPVTAVQKWFKSMEWIESENAEGQMVRNSDNGRDFNLYLEVVDPSFLKDPVTGQLISQEELQGLKDMWQSKEWDIEFHDVQLQKVSEENGEATVELIAGNVRYIGDAMFGTKEYKMDDFKTKKGEVYLKWYESVETDPLKQLYPEKAVSRWVVTGGLDLSEDKTF